MSIQKCVNDVTIKQKYVMVSLTYSLTFVKWIMPIGKFSEMIIKTFGSFEEFKKQFSEAGKTRFASGWAWLCADDKGNLFIYSTPTRKILCWIF